MPGESRDGDRPVGGRRDRLAEGRRDPSVGGRADSTAKGRAGEAIAAFILESEGWTILERNYRGPRGEIDIIAAKADSVVFFEVKNWSVFDAGELATAISARKAKRIVETSKIFLSRNREYSDARLRYDVLLIKEGRIVRRIESAFTGET